MRSRLTSLLGTGTAHGAAIVALMLGWAAASVAEPVPEFYGFYAVDGGKLIELKESSREWPGVGPGVRFIKFAKGGYGSGDAHVSRMRYLRNNIDPDATPAVSAVNKWYISTDTSRDVELRGKPITGQPEMLMLVPREPLTEGAYTVVIDKSPIARFLVNAESVRKNLQTGADCVDHVYEGMGEQFDWDKFDQRMAGQHKVVVCSQSQTVTGAGPGSSGAVNKSIQATSASGSTAAPAIAAAVPSTRSAGYQNCISLGTPAASCNILYPAAAQEPGAAAGTSGARPASTDELSAQLTALMQRPAPASGSNVKSHNKPKSGLAFEYPATFDLAEGEAPVVAWLKEQGSETTDATRTKISVTQSSPCVSSQQVSLDAAVTGTLEGTRAALSNASIAGPFATALAGAEARIFVVQGLEEGVMKQKAVTVGLANNCVLGVVLHATPDRFEGAWDAYQQVKGTYTVTGESSVVK